MGRGILILAWAIAQSYPNASRTACENLERQGFSFYNPKIKERVKLKHGFTWRTVQMFRNYLFVDIFDQWRAVKSTFGISHVLMAESEKPAVMADEFITSLRQQEGPDGLIVLQQSKYTKGSLVQIKSGPFAYSLCRFEGLSSNDRVIVLLSMLGGQQRVEMSLDNIRPV